MLSVLFAIEACYTIKENIKKNHFADVSYHFAGENCQKPILRRYFFTKARKYELQGLINKNWK